MKKLIAITLITLCMTALSVAASAQSETETSWFMGVWSTNDGPVALWQSGEAVYGVYGTEGVLGGNVGENGVFEFYYEKGTEDYGTGWFRLKEDRVHFTGFVTSEFESHVQGPWEGTLVGPNEFDLGDREALEDVPEYIIETEPEVSDVTEPVEQPVVIEEEIQVEDPVTLYDEETVEETTDQPDNVFTNVPIGSTTVDTTEETTEEVVEEIPEVEVVEETTEETTEEIVEEITEETVVEEETEEIVEETVEETEEEIIVEPVEEEEEEEETVPIIVTVDPNNAWNGTWETGRGDLVITAGGGFLNGTFDDNGTIEGIIDNEQVTITWSVTADDGTTNEGEALFYLADDGLSFRGTYNRSDVPDLWLPWAGTKTSD